MSTPLDPGDALSRYSTLSNSPSDPFNNHKARRRHQPQRQDTWHPREKEKPALGTKITRSISANSVPRAYYSSPQHRLYNTDTPRSPVYYGSRPELFKYSRRQIAGYCHYEQKAKRLSSWEYGVGSDSDDRCAPYRTIKEQEGLSTAPTRQQEDKFLIARKAIGSAPSTPFKETASTDTFDWTYKNEHPTTISSAQGGAEQPNPILYTRLSTKDSIENQLVSPASPLRLKVERRDSKADSRKQSSVSSPSTDTQQDFESNQTVVHPIPIDPGTYFINLCTVVAESVQAIDEQTVKAWLIWMAKLLLLLYLASCIWDIIAAIRDAVFKAFDPLLPIWRLLRRILGV